MNTILKFNLQLACGIIILNNIQAQSIHFTHSANGSQIVKEIKADEKIFTIEGVDKVCKGEAFEWHISTNESAAWNNGTIGVKSVYTIVRDTLIKAVLKNEQDCEYVQTKFVQVLDLPQKPVIERKGDSLIVLNVTGQFEWYRDGQLFSIGLNYIRPDLEGQYTVKVKNAEGCENVSDGFQFIITSNNDLTLDKITLYPNPTSGFIQIVSSRLLSVEYKWSIFSSEGKKHSVLINNNKIDISMFSNGIYFLNCQKDGKSHYFKVVKVD
ncbi:MAG: T9SS type A sorting domain-containing protein [Chitinophagaceae bacterium]|nr:T9SS type A sorting domain-containing protein [Chitinophagaceae bacterium]